jgi:outer membrane lipoprotein-sorting protein
MVYLPRAAFALFVGVLVIAGVELAVISSSPNIAFAQVVSQLDEVKSVQYTETRSDIPRAGELRGPTEVKKVTILGRSRMREEWTSVTAGDPLPKGDEWSAAEQGTIIVTDLLRGRYLTLDPKTKTYSFIVNFASISPDDGKISISKAAAAPEVDFFKSLRLFPAVDAEHLPARDVAGHKMIGFRSIEKTQHKNGLETWTRTYWVDPKSKLPVQIEITSESTDPNMGQSRWVLSDIVFDQAVDESLLSTEPPKGYTENK